MIRMSIEDGLIPTTDNNMPWTRATPRIANTFRFGPPHNDKAMVPKMAPVPEALSTVPSTDSSAKLSINGVVKTVIIPEEKCPKSKYTNNPARPGRCHTNHNASAASLYIRIQG